MLTLAFQLVNRGLKGSSDVARRHSAHHQLTTDEPTGACSVGGSCVVALPWYIHPIVATGLILLVALNMHWGTRLSRMEEDDPPFERLRTQHIWTGSLAVILGPLVEGLGLWGIVSAGEPMLGSLHGFTGLLIGALFVILGLLGLMLRAGKEHFRSRHRLLAWLLLMLLLFQATTGMVLAARIF